jgi:hypothetical protein
MTSGNAFVALVVLVLVASQGAVAVGPPAPPPVGEGGGLEGLAGGSE